MLMDNAEKKKEVVSKCLDTFIRQGLSETSVRDLSRALNLQAGGIYYYFKDRDDVVAACAEEAAIRLEEQLIGSALKNISDPEKMLRKLYSGCDEMASTMKFFASVCALSRYEKSVAPVLERLSKRYDYYAEIFADRLGCELDEVRPYLFMVITTMSDYMIFGGKSYVEPQLRVFGKKLGELLEKKKED